MNPVGTFGNSGHYFTAPAAAFQSIVVTLGTTKDESCAGAISLKDVNQSTPIGTHGTASGDGGGGAGTATVTVTATDDEWLVDNVYMRDEASGILADAGQDQRWSEQLIANIVAGGGSTQPGNTAGDVMSWSSGILFSWTIGAVPIRGIAAPPNTQPGTAGMFDPELDVRAWF